MSMSNPTTPGQQHTRPGQVPVDLTAVLAALQDQLDDLTTVVEAQQRRIEDLERQLRERTG